MSTKTQRDILYVLYTVKTYTQSSDLFCFEWVTMGQGEKTMFQLNCRLADKLTVNPVSGNFCLAIVYPIKRAKKPREFSPPPGCAFPQAQYG